MGDDDKEEGKEEEIDSDAEPERLQYKVNSFSFTRYDMIPCVHRSIMLFSLFSIKRLFQRNGAVMH